MRKYSAGHAFLSAAVLIGAAVALAQSAAAPSPNGAHEQAPLVQGFLLTTKWGLLGDVSLFAALNPQARASGARRETH
jgi:hypothetical protein